MTQEEIKAILEKQRKYFLSGATLPIENRVIALKKLYSMIVDNEKDLQNAL